MSHRQPANAEPREARLFAAPVRTTVIEKNGREYLVTINGAVFLALSLAEAEAIARRAVGSRPDAR